MDNDEYSWVQTHKELTDFLSSMENSQFELIQILKSIGIGPLSDKAEMGKQSINLEEIDPFTFFCYLYKYGPERRLRNLQKVAEKLNLTIPKGDSGIPSAQAQKVWLFPYKYERTNNEIGRLWNLFKKVIINQVTDKDFADALLIRNTGKMKLTEALFYIKPDKYLPLNSPTNAYLNEVLNIEPNFNTFEEYLTILSRIKEKTDKPFFELSYEAWKWNAETKKINYWIFQGNPKVFDFETALRNKILTNWTIGAYKDKINIGDKVILWITGNQPGCYALAEITSKPYQKTTSLNDNLWKSKNNNTYVADIEIKENLVDDPVLFEDIKKLDELNNLKVGNQGTNFSSSKEEYEGILNLLKNKNEKRYWLWAPGKNAHMWEEFHHEGIFALGWDEIGDFSKLKSRDEIKRALFDEYGGSGSKKNDVSAISDFLNKVKIGDTIIAKKGRGELLGFGIVSSDHIYNENRQYFQNTRKIDWKLKGNWKVDFSLVLKTLTDITKDETDDPAYSKYYEKLLNIMGQNEKFENKDYINFPLNTILYGPPGTGKTYNTVLRAAEIIENRKIDSYEEALEIFKANLHDQVEFITFHQNYSYEDFIQGIRPDTENDKELTFERKDGVFKVISDKALKNILASEKPPVAKLKFEDVFNVFISPLVEGEVEEIEVKMKKVSYFITAITNKSIEFRKTNGGSEHTLSIATLRKMYDSESVLDIQGLSSYYSPLLIELLNIGKDASGKKEIVQRKNYVIIIDEINRANISRVFGELITLIEPDKRSHGKIPMEVKLPSGDTFMVPSNLFIIGTMNTADKSIALLDIALRRRFEFESMYPKYSEDGLKVNQEFVLKSINESIISEKGYDFQIGHSYFMDSKEDPYNFEKRMNVKVIPLLLEYFMNDAKTVTQIVSKAIFHTQFSIDEKSWPLKISNRND